jgi:hypothetical protein
LPASEFVFISPISIHPRRPSAAIRSRSHSDSRRAASKFPAANAPPPAQANSGGNTSGFQAAPAQPRDPAEFTGLFQSAPPKLEPESPELSAGALESTGVFTIHQPASGTQVSKTTVESTLPDVALTITACADRASKSSAASSAN